MTSKLSVSYVIVVFALMAAFNGVHADEFFLRGPGESKMYVPDKAFRFAVDVGSPNGYLSTKSNPIYISVGWCSVTMELVKDAQNTMTITNVNTPVNLIDQTYMNFCVYSEDKPNFCDPNEAGVQKLSGCQPQYEPASPSGYKIKMIAYGGSIPPDFEIHSFRPPAPSTKPTTQSTSTGKSKTESSPSTEAPTSLTEAPINSTGFPQTWHIIAISVGLVLLSLLLSGAILFIVLRRNKRKKVEESRGGPSSNAFNQRVITLPSNVAKPRVVQPDF